MEQALLRASEVAEVIALGRTKTYELIQRGEIPSVYIGKSRRVPVEALRRWIAERALEATTGGIDAR